MVQLRGTKKGLSTHTRTHLHLPSRCSEELRRACLQHPQVPCGGGGRTAADSPLPALSSATALRPADLRGGRRGNPFPRPKEKNKYQTSFAFPPLPGYASAKEGGTHWQLAAKDKRQSAQSVWGTAELPSRGPGLISMAAPPSAPVSPEAGGRRRTSRPAPVGRGQRRHRPGLAHRRSHPAPRSTTGNL